MRERAEGGYFRDSRHSKGISPVNSPGYPHTVKLCFVNPILSWCNYHKGNSRHSKGVSPVNSLGYPHIVKLCFVNPGVTVIKVTVTDRQIDRRTKWINIYDWASYVPRRVATCELWPIYEKSNPFNSSIRHAKCYIV